jgi:6-pyruvoyltetrahydropterin/6-carboxytetrahydropterin synthase
LNGPDHHGPSCPKRCAVSYKSASGNQGSTHENYAGELQLEGAVDPESGFLVDFFDIEAAFGALLKKLDHYCLNEITGLENPTAENIAIWIWDRVKVSLPSLAAVRVFETPDCWAEYDGT